MQYTYSQMPKRICDPKLKVKINALLLLFTRDVHVLDFIVYKSLISMYSLLTSTSLNANALCSGDL